MAVHERRPYPVNGGGTLTVESVCPQIGGPEFQTPVSGPAPSAMLARNGLIAYESDVAGPAEVYVMHPDGSRKRRLTHSGDNDEPSWSPDGRRIAFEHFGAKSSALWVMNANGSNQRRLTSVRSLDTDPKWSPDGRHIAFTRGRNCYEGPNCDIWLIPPNGTGEWQLTRDGRSSTPSWSPDGTEIAFTHLNADDIRVDVYVMNADATGERNLTAGLQGDSYDPAWSPDGRTIAFTYHACPDCDEVLAFMNPDGTHLRHLNFRYQGESVPVEEHAWSPDGKWIVFGTQQTLWVMNFLTGSKFRRVAFNGDNHSPAWQPLPRKR